MSRDRKLIIFSCLLLVCISAAGTIAYLTDKTDPVVNTFTVGKLLEETDKFELVEHGIQDNDKNGVYEFTSDEETTNYYKVLPGVDLPKDPFVRTTGPLKLDAYVFIEVDDKLGNNLSAEVDTDLWEKLDGVKGPTANGDVYVLKSAGYIAEADTTLNVNILKDKKIKVTSTEVTDTAAADYSGSITFYGYMIQAGGFNDYIEAWEGLDPAPAP